MESRRNGFTLLEVLVALVLFGLLLVVLTQGLQFGMLAWRTEARLAAANANLNEIDATLRRLIEALDPGSDDQDRPALLASQDAMTFVTELPDSKDAGVSRLVEATLRVDPRHVLILRWRPLTNLGDGGVSPPWVQTEILRGVSRMRLAFWRLGGGWIGDWRYRDPPAMIRIRLSFVDGGARHWPDIVAAPLLDRE